MPESRLILHLKEASDLTQVLWLYTSMVNICTLVLFVTDTGKLLLSNESMQVLAVSPCIPPAYHQLSFFTYTAPPNYLNSITFFFFFFF